MKTTRIKQQPPRLSNRTNDRSTKQTTPFYKTQEWRKFAAYIVFKRGRLCEICFNNILSKRVFVDHIIEIKDGGGLFDENNVQVLCGSCHTTKTLRMRRMRQERILQ